MGRRWWNRIALGCAVLVPMGTGLQADDQASNAPPASAVQLDADAIDLEAVSEDLNGLVAFYEAEQAPGRFWIGVSCEPVSDSLRAQLDLAADVGLLINEVMDDSPAKLAGMQPHDVLISVTASLNGKTEERKLAAIEQLSEVVQQSEAKPLKLVLLRKGKRQTVEVAPVERPKQDHLITNFVDVTLNKHLGNPERVQELLRQLQEEVGGGPQGVRLHMTAPIVVTAPPVPAPPALPADPSNPFVMNYSPRFERHVLPEGTTLTITKSGNAPVRIEVKQGEGKVWGAKEDEIDTLPEEARALARAAVAGINQSQFNFVNVMPVKPGWTTAQGGGYGAGFITSRPVPPEQLKEIAELHRQLATELTEKGAEHPDVKRLQGKIEAAQKSLPRLTATKTAPATAKSVRTVIESTRSNEKPVPTVTKQAADAQTQIERLEKQVQELLRMQAKQAEAQQQQLRELHKVLEKLSTKE